MEMLGYKKEGSHLYETVTDEWGRESWVHCYQYATKEEDTEENMLAMIEAFIQC